MYYESMNHFFLLGFSFWVCTTTFVLCYHLFYFVFWYQYFVPFSCTIWLIGFIIDSTLYHHHNMPSQITFICLYIVIVLVIFVMGTFNFKRLKSDKSTDLERNGLIIINLISQVCLVLFRIWTFCIKIKKLGSAYLRKMTKINTRSNVALVTSKSTSTWIKIYFLKSLMWSYHSRSKQWHNYTMTRS